MITGRGADVSFVLDQLTGPRPAWRHARMIDKSHIGMAGHSIGGASAVPAMLGDSRIRAGINLDGAFHDPVPAGGLGRPFLMLGTDDDVHRPGGRDRTWDAAWAHLDGWKRWLTVAGANQSATPEFDAVVASQRTARLAGGLWLGTVTVP